MQDLRQTADSAVDFTPTQYVRAYMIYDTSLIHQSVSLKHSGSQVFTLQAGIAVLHIRVSQEHKLSSLRNAEQQYTEKSCSVNFHTRQCDNSDIIMTGYVILLLLLGRVALLDVDDLSVCASVCPVHCGKTADRIRMPLVS